MEGVLYFETEEVVLYKYYGCVSDIQYKLPVLAAQTVSLYMDLCPASRPRTGSTLYV
jgi:hypothetical protein